MSERPRRVVGCWLALRFSLSPPEKAGRRGDRGLTIGLTRETVWVMTEVSVRDLRNHGGDVLDSVMRGESVTVTRQGKPVAELRPIAEAGIPATVLVQRWHTIPVIDLADLRTDLDDVLDPAL